jgi:hypothetical protein
MIRSSGLKHISQLAIPCAVGKIALLITSQGYTKCAQTFALASSKDYCPTETRKLSNDFSTLSERLESRIEGPLCVADRTQLSTSVEVCKWRFFPLRSHIELSNGA